MDPGVLAACKILMHRDRLRILGALAAGDATARALAVSLGLPQRAVLRHLDQLRHAGLVQSHDTGSQPDPVQVLYLARLAAIASELARFEAAQRPSTSDLPQAAEAAEGQPDGAWSQDEARVLRTFVEDGRLTTIPAQLSKRRVILRFLAASAFSPGETYPEKEVNMRLALRHPDVASLRRYLVDEGLMDRTAGIYRLREQGAGSTEDPAN